MITISIVMYFVYSFAMLCFSAIYDILEKGNVKPWYINALMTIATPGIEVIVFILKLFAK